MVRPSSETRAQRRDALRNLVETLRANDRSVAWLARRLNAPPTTVANYISGERRMPEDMLERISGVLGVPASVLAPPDQRHMFTRMPSTQSRGKVAKHDLKQHNTSSNRTRRAQSETPRIDTTPRKPVEQPTRRRRQRTEQPPASVH